MVSAAIGGRAMKGMVGSRQLRSRCDFLEMDASVSVLPSCRNAGHRWPQRTCFMRSRRNVLPVALCMASCLVLLASGCGGDSESDAGGAAKPLRRQFLSMGTAPVGGAFPVVGGAIAEVLLSLIHI